MGEETPKDKRLPEHARCVFKGVMFEVWQWEQTMYDGSVQLFERIKRPDTAEVFVVTGDKILIEEQEQPDSSEPFFSIPGGRCELGEDPLRAAKRELLEETGYVSDDWELWRTLPGALKELRTGFVYIARAARKAQEPTLDAGEKITTRLVSFDELLLLSDEQRFRSRDLTILFLRTRLDPVLKEEFRKKLFK